MNESIKFHVEPATCPDELWARSEMLSDEEYLSNDDSLSLRLQRDSEIRFGPAYYKATIYDRSGKSVFDFGARRFFSCAVYGRDSSKAVSPWSPTSLCVALPELLNTRPGPGIKIARMSIFDVARQLTVAAWDFESLVTHKMWSVDGKFYLFRDVYGIYIFSTGGQNLISISESRSPHCFVLEGRFVCVIEKSGDVSVLDGSSGTLLVKEHFSKDGYTVRRARFDEQQNRVLVLVTHQDGSDAGRLCYSIRLRATN